MGWFGGRSDSVGAKLTRVCVTRTVNGTGQRESLVHEIVALKSYRDQLRATLAGIDAEIAAKNTRLAAHDAESRTGSEEYQRLKTPRAAKKPARSVSEGGK